MTVHGGLALHESLEIRELLSIKNISLIKARAMQGWVKDKNLSSLLQQEVQESAKEIKQLQGILQKLL